MHFNNPEELEALLLPIGGDINIRPVKGTTFSANIAMRPMNKLGMFMVKGDSFKALKEPQQDFYGITIPLSTAFDVYERSKPLSFKSLNGHVHRPNEHFDFRSEFKTDFLVCNLFVEPLAAFMQSNMQKAYTHSKFEQQSVPFKHQAGSLLTRSILYAWNALQENSKPLSKIEFDELEDNILTTFVNFSDQTNSIENRQHKSHIAKAEEYILANLKNSVTRDNIAEAVDIPIRSLSRGFEKKFGVGPKQFLKQRRFDAAYADLVNAKNGEKTVTHVALNYGFSHTGKFAIEFKNIFGELPSEVLKV